MPEWLKGTGCKPVSIAYVGSNPTPTTNYGVTGEVEYKGIGIVFVVTGHASGLDGAR